MGKNKEIEERIVEKTIIVNGVRKEFEGDKISYEQLVKLVGNHDDRISTVVYTKGINGAEGNLNKGESVRVANGMYFFFSKRNEQIENNFSYHPPKEGQPEQYEQIRAHAKSLAYLIDKMVPNGREKSLAMTNLEQAVFWANAGIARNGEPNQSQRALSKMIDVLSETEEPPPGPPLMRY